MNVQVTGDPILKWAETPDSFSFNKGVTITAGNFGVGDSTPSYKIEVAGAAAGVASLYITSGDNTYTTPIIQARSNNGNVVTTVYFGGIGNNDALLFYSGGANERARFAAAGEFQVKVDLAFQQVNGLVVPVTLAEQITTRQHLFNDDFFRYPLETLC